MDLYLLIIPIGIYIAGLYSAQEVFCKKIQVTLIFKVDLFLGKIFLRILYNRKIAEN